MTSAMSVQCSNQLSYEVTQSRAVQFVGLMFSLHVRGSYLLFITYGIAVWGQAAQTNLYELLILQKRAPHLIHFAPYRSHAIPLFNHYNIFPLNFQYYKSVCTIYYARRF